MEEINKKNEARTKVLASQLSLDCRVRRSGWVGSTTLISSAFTALLNRAEVGRRNRILTNYRFLSNSHFFSDEDELELLELEFSLDDEEELNCSGWSSL